MFAVKLSDSLLYNACIPSSDEEGVTRSVTEGESNDENIRHPWLRFSKKHIVCFFPFLQTQIWTNKIKLRMFTQIFILHYALCIIHYSLSTIHYSLFTIHYCLGLLPPTGGFASGDISACRCVPLLMFIITK